MARDDELLTGEEVADEAIRAADREPATDPSDDVGARGAGPSIGIGGAAPRGGEDADPAGGAGPGGIAPPDEDGELGESERDSVYGASQADG